MCPVCRKNPANKHPTLGVLPCDSCNERQAKLTKPSEAPEFTTEGIKRQRKEFADDIEQFHRKGEINKRWVEIHGEEKALQRGATKEEIKKAKYVYAKDDTYYGH